MFAVLLTSAGCGTDAKPSYITSVFKDPSEIDRLAECLIDTPVVNEDEGIVTIQADISCLADVTAKTMPDLDQPVHTSLTEIIDNPESYFGRVLTFEAVGKEFHNYQLALYTNQANRSCYLNFVGYSFYYNNSSCYLQDFRPANTVFNRK